MHTLPEAYKQIPAGNKPPLPCPTTSPQPHPEDWGRKCWQGCARRSSQAVSVNTHNRRRILQRQDRTPMWSSNPTTGYIARGSDVSTLERHLKSQVYQESTRVTRVNGESAEVSMVGIKTRTECRTHIKQNTMQGRLKQPFAAWVNLGVRFARWSKAGTQGQRLWLISHGYQRLDKRRRDEERLARGTKFGLCRRRRIWNFTAPPGQY